MKRVRVEKSNHDAYLIFLDLGPMNDVNGGYHLTRDEAARLRNRIDGILNPPPPKEPGS